MTVQHMQNRATAGRVPGFWHGETVTAATTGAVYSDPLLIPPLPSPVAVTMTVIPSGVGIGAVQYTTSSDSDLTASTVNWIDWALGSVTTAQSDGIVTPITGLRCKATKSATTAGTVIFEVVA